MRQWMIWLRPPWGADVRRQELLAAADEDQGDDRRRAFELRLGGTPEILNERPDQPESWWMNQW